MGYFPIVSLTLTQPSVKITNMILPAPLQGAYKGWRIANFNLKSSLLYLP